MPVGNHGYLNEKISYKSQNIMHLSKMKNWSGLFILSLASTVPAVYSEETKKGSCKMVVSSSIKGGKEKQIYL